MGAEQKNNFFMNVPFLFNVYRCVYGMKAVLGPYPPSNASTTATITDLP
jgi:hypothetical protein